MAKDSRGSRAADAGAVQAVDDGTESTVSEDSGCSASPVLQNLPLTKISGVFHTKAQDLVFTNKLLEVT